MGRPVLNHFPPSSWSSAPPATAGPIAWLPHLLNKVDMITLVESFANYNSTRLPFSDFSPPSVCPTPAVTYFDTESSPHQPPSDNDEIFCDALEDLPGLDQPHPQSTPFDASSTSAGPTYKRKPILIAMPPASLAIHHDPIPPDTQVLSQLRVARNVPSTRSNYSDVDEHKRPSYASMAARSVNSLVLQQRDPEDVFCPAPIKKALVVGLKYSRSGVDGSKRRSRLRDPVKDATRFAQSLKSFGYKINNTKLTADEPGFEAPTRANLVRSIEGLVHGARSGDVLCFHFSGHPVKSRQVSAELPTARMSSLVDVSLSLDWDMARVSASSQTHCGVNQHHENTSSFYPYDLAPELFISQDPIVNLNLNTPQFVQEPNLSALVLPDGSADILLNPTPDISTSFYPGLSSDEYNSGFFDGITACLALAAPAPPTQTEPYSSHPNHTDLPRDSMVAETLRDPNPAVQHYSIDVPVDPWLAIPTNESELLPISRYTDPPSRKSFSHNLTPGGDFGLGSQSPDLDTMANPCADPQVPRSVSSPKAPPPEPSGNFPTTNTYHLTSRQEDPPASTPQTQMTQLPQQTASGSESSHVSEMSPAHAGTENPKNYCDICGRSFRRPYLLDDHKRIHTSEETSTYRCEFEGCFKVYKSRSNMARHFKTHFRPDKARSMLQTNDEHVLDGISEQTPAAELSTQDMNSKTSMRPLDQATPIPSNFRFRPYETPDSVRHKVGKKKA